jgi:predicted transcriptional regulator
MILKNKIIEAGIKIGYIEKEAGIPKTALNQFLDGNRTLPKKQLDNLKKVLRKYKINFVV